MERTPLLGSKEANQKKLSSLMLVLLACNTMNGPGLLALGSIFGKAGWAYGVVGVGVAAGVTGKTVSLLNDILQEHAGEEFSDLSHKILGEKGYLGTMTVLSCSLAALTCAQIVVTSQAVDSFLVNVFGTSSLLRLYPSVGLLTTTSQSLTPFPEGTYGVSLGFALDAVFCIFLGRLDITDNIFPQMLSSLLSVVSLGMLLMYLSETRDPEGSVPIVGSDSSELLGVSVFCFAFVLAVPSLHDTARHKGTFKTAMKSAVFIMFVICCLIGVIGGSYGPTPVPGNLLQAVFESSPPEVVKLAGYGYCLALLLPIPVYSILLKRNLASLTDRPGFYSIAVPWVAAGVCYLQPWFTSLLNWSSLLCLGFINFTVPLLLVVYHPDCTVSTPRRRGTAVFLLYFTTFVIVCTILQNLFK